MSKQQLKILFITLSMTGLVFGVLAFAVAQAKLFGPRGNDDLSRMLIQSLTAQATNSTGRGPVQNLRFTVYDAGIFPRQLRARPGVVAIVLEDHTHRRPGVVIESENGGGRQLVGEISFPLNQSRIRTEFRLGVGRYRVSEATNSAIGAELIIQP